MCENEGGWSPQTFCGPKGVCVNRTCICEPGWGNDLTIFKTRNCWMPSPAVQVIDGTAGALSFIVFLMCLRQAMQARSYARTHILFTACSMLAASAYLLSHYLEGGTHGPATMVLFNVAIFFVSNGIALASYHLLKTFWRMSGKKSHLKMAVIIFQLSETLSLIGCTAAMIVLNDDDYGFSIAMTILLLIFASHFALLLLFVIVSTNHVIETVEGAPMMLQIGEKEVAKDSPGLAAIEEGKTVSDTEKRRSLIDIASSALKREKKSDLKEARKSSLLDRRTSHADSTGGSQRFLDKKSQALVDKVRTYRKFGRFAGPIVVVAMFVVCCLEWIQGSVPLIWIVFAVSVMHFPVVGFAQTQLAKQTTTKDSPALGSSQQQLLLTSNSGPKSPRSNSIIL